jgi:hypothetical protein
MEQFNIFQMIAFALFMWFSLGFSGWTIAFVMKKSCGIKTIYGNK